eukprot:scaffold15109_cov70-Skeletonema_dohrnii-CCMP3373.AAC.3
MVVNTARNPAVLCNFVLSITSRDNASRYNELHVISIHQINCRMRVITSNPTPIRIDITYVSFNAPNTTPLWLITFSSEDAAVKLLRNVEDGDDSIAPERRESP